MGSGPNDLGLSRRHLTDALDASLRRLGVERVDLYQVHAYDAFTPIEETLRFVDDAVSAGKIHYFGLSNFTGWQLQRAVDVAEFRHLTPPVTLQPQYNLLVREIEWEIVPACAANGLGLLPWSPLGGGWLTGKYTRDERPTGTTRLGEDPERGVEAYDRRGPVQRTWDVVDAVREVADGRGCTMAQVALAWLVDRPTVTSVILGARTVEQLDDNLGAAGLHLTEDETARLDAASDPGCRRLPVRRSRGRAAGAQDRGWALTAQNGTSCASRPAPDARPDRMRANSTAAAARVEAVRRAAAPTAGLACIAWRPSPSSTSVRCTTEAAQRRNRQPWALPSTSPAGTAASSSSPGTASTRASGTGWSSCPASSSRCPTPTRRVSPWSAAVWPGAAGSRSAVS
jgi:aryl-alcohol dehydrogenase-like predicted oxidoreductase